MNWYKSKVSKGIVKIASHLKMAADVDNLSPDNQNASQLDIFDIQRYVMDSYTIKVAISSTSKKISVSIQTNHGFLGSIVWAEYWYYDLDEYKKAKNTYDKLNEIVQRVTHRFVDEEIPTPLLWPFIKKESDTIDPKGAYRSNIPCVNYSDDYSNLMSPDWRSNIYGTRYPKYQEVSYKQYLNQK